MVKSQLPETFKERAQDSPADDEVSLVIVPAVDIGM